MYNIPNQLSLAIPLRTRQAVLSRRQAQPGLMFFIATDNFYQQKMKINFAIFLQYFCNISSKTLQNHAITLSNIIYKTNKPSTCFYSAYLVRPKGIEPPAFGTGIQRSIQLSYGRMSVNPFYEKSPLKSSGVLL